MDRVKTVENNIMGVTEQASSAYVPPFQLTAGQPAPIAANGGLSYMSFDRDGDGGTAMAMEAARRQVAKGEGHAVLDMIENAPPGPVETKWGLGFRKYAECLEYIRAHNIEAPEVVSRFRSATLSMNSRPTQLSRPTRSGTTRRARLRQKCFTRKSRRSGGAVSISRRYCAMRAAWRSTTPVSRPPARVHGQARRLARPLRIEVPEFLRRSRGGARVLPGD